MSQFQHLLRLQCQHYWHSPWLYCANSQTELTGEECWSRVVKLQRKYKSQGISKASWLMFELENSRADLLNLWALWGIGCAVALINPKFPSELKQRLWQQHGFHFWLKHAHVINKRFAANFRRPIHTLLGILTSGSTGQPKLVCHSFDSLLTHCQSNQTISELDQHSVQHASLPMFHIGGAILNFRVLFAKARLVIGGKVEEPELLANYQISHASMVATQLNRFLQNPKVKHNQLKQVLVGGGPVDETLLLRAKEYGIPARLTYGQSEAASQVLTQDKKGYMQPLANMQLKTDEQGQLWLKGPAMMQGYWQNGRFTGLDRDGWFATGDIVEQIDSSWRVIGRVDNQFISGGENIQPETIEQTLQSFACIEQAVVVPKNDAEYGQRPVAWIKRCSHVCDSAQNCQALGSCMAIKLKQKLPSFLRPIGYFDLPEQTSLKLDRQALIAHWN